MPVILARGHSPARVRYLPSSSRHPVLVELPGWLLVATVVTSVLALLLLLMRAQLAIDPRNMVDQMFGLTAVLAIGARFALRRPTSRSQQVIRDAIDHIGLFSLVCIVGALASYPVAADSTGYDDRLLEGVDRLLRFDWVSWYDVVAAHPWLQVAETVAYQSIFVTPAVLLIYFAVSGRRAEARLFIASFWLAALITLILFAMAPARGPLAYLWRGHIPYMPESALYQAQLIPLLRSHALHSIAVGSLHGLVCAPSFHTVSAVLFIVAAWPIRALRWPVLALNIAMLLATPVEGTHYLTDMIVGGLVALLATLAVRRLADVVEERTVAAALDPLRLPLRRVSNRDLMQMLGDESSNGPRATAILQEIDRRGMDV